MGSVFFTIDRLWSGLEELDWIPVGIFHLDLTAAGTSLCLIAKPHPRVPQRVDLRGQIRHAQDHSIPSARVLGFAAWHRTGSRCSWPTEQQREIAKLCWSMSHFRLLLRHITDE
jgi:hypothetical protein